MIVGGLMVRADRPSFEWVFPLHLQRLLPLVDQLYVRVDLPGKERVIPFLDDPKITWEYQNEKPTHHHHEEMERQALLDYAFTTDAKWMVVLDADEVLEEGAAEALRDYLQSDPAPDGFRLPLTYSSHHRDGYVLDRDETGVNANRIFRLNESMRDYRYRSDGDGLHCGSIPELDARAIVLKGIVTVHYHATTPEEWAMKRQFYAGTYEVKRFWDNAEYGAYPECGEYPYHCDRFGKERNAVPLESVLVNREQRFANLLSRPGGKRRRRVYV